jgi:hypothetical protein
VSVDALDWFRTTPLALASGMVWGRDPAALPLPAAPPGLTARAALEAAMVRALHRPPCVVSFSGGRDSSALLALATHVARREGLPLPIPISLRFPGCEAADEDSWQELVVRHLGISDWIKLVMADELDNLGPYARAVLERHGVLWPSNAHSQLPIAEQAPGGTLLTGFGGDELFTISPVWRRINQVLAGQVPWVPRDALRLAAAYGPAPLRRAVVRRWLADAPPCPWLHSDAQRELAMIAVQDVVAVPVRWDVGMDTGWWRLRYRSIAEASIACIAGMHDVAVCHPLTDSFVVSAIAREGGRVGFPSRTAAMQHIVGDLLPEQVTARTSKAALTGAFWNRYSTAFAASWDRTGVDPEIVDVEVLHRMWTAAEHPPDARTFPLLQSSWLASRPLADTESSG